MSSFSVGGNAGVALGPVVTTPLVLAFGLKGMLFLAAPAAVMAVLLLREVPGCSVSRPGRPRTVERRPGSRRIAGGRSRA